jgi:hypothetical protein
MSHDSTDNSEIFQPNKSTRRGNRNNSSPSIPETRASDNEVETTWTEEEDEKLRINVLLYREKNWKKIAESIPGKTPAQCMHRYKTVLNPDTLKVKGRWTPEVNFRSIIHHYFLIKKVLPFRFLKISQNLKTRYLDFIFILLTLNSENFSFILRIVFLILFVFV